MNNDVVDSPTQQDATETVSSEPKVNRQTAPTSTGNQKKSNIRYLYILLVVSLVIFALGGYYYGHKNVANLNSQINNLNQQVSSLKKANSSESTSANTATTANCKIYSDTKAIAYGTQSPQNTLMIDSGKSLVTSALYTPCYKNVVLNASNGGIVLVTVKITNTTPATQTYDLTDFTVQLPGGEILNSPPNTSNSDTIAAGGSSTEYLVFLPSNTPKTVGNGYLIYTSPTSNQITKASIVFKAPYTQ